MAWEELAAVWREQDDAYADEQQRIPSACPRCGEPLLTRDGVLHCRFDGYTYRL